jgi:hypothetical protein
LLRRALRQRHEVGLNEFEFVLFDGIGYADPFEVGQNDGNGLRPRLGDDGT